MSIISIWILCLRGVTRTAKGRSGSDVTTNTDAIDLESCDARPGHKTCAHRWAVLARGHAYQARTTAHTNGPGARMSNKCEKYRRRDPYGQRVGRWPSAPPQNESVIEIRMKGHTTTLEHAERAIPPQLGTRACHPRLTMFAPG